MSSLIASHLPKIKALMLDHGVIKAYLFGKGRLLAKQ